MELRTLRYFLALAHAGTISGAAKELHVTQPTLSRQLADLEKEFGTTLFERGSKRIRLTVEGVRLRDYATSIVALADKATADLAQPDRAVGGSVFIGCGESEVMRTVFRAAKRCRDEHPDVRFHLFSGTSIDLEDRFNDGLLDFLVEFEPLPHPDRLSLSLPESDRWGVLMRKDDPLAERVSVRPENVAGRTVIGSRQGMKSGKMREWAGELHDRLDVVLTYNLGLNAAIAVEEGMGVMFCYDRLIRLPEDGALCFRPIDPPVYSDSAVVWKKHRHLSNAAEAFLQCLREECTGEVSIGER
ncbi:MAG TPA: LysR family transcriptional regulator [Candidatus Aveggerthella stercoripullorum]|uniref:LysR family transcriptional regulator n=1 Tax=Candidatus Aveggerthella stercoripullorum TaxID=2840688 RepID=A0A9D0ZYZ6_9ACTN|nr:LysR family transcriptional regulator [Candidatus Aveggerthella stercoripullorum]